VTRLSLINKHIKRDMHKFGPSMDLVIRAINHANFTEKTGNFFNIIEMQDLW